MTSESHGTHDIKIIMIITESLIQPRMGKCSVSLCSGCILPQEAPLGICDSSGNQSEDSLFSAFTAGTLTATLWNHNNMNHYYC